MEKLFIQTEDGVREYTVEEYALHEADKRAEELAAELKAAAEIKKAAALEKLKELGLDADDLKALGL